MIHTEFLSGPLPPPAADDSRRDDGSEVIFHGRVRDREDGTAIIALDYEHYPGMAEKELAALAGEAAAKFPIRDLSCHHRVGRIPVGEIAIRVVIWSRHRQAGFDALGWFVRELKQRVPIWKWAVDADGNRLPSSTGEAAADDVPAAG